MTETFRPQLAKQGTCVTPITEQIFWPALGIILWLWQLCEDDVRTFVWGWDQDGPRRFGHWGETFHGWSNYPPTNGSGPDHLDDKMMTIRWRGERIERTDERQPLQKKLHSLWTEASLILIQQHHQQQNKNHQDHHQNPPDHHSIDLIIIVMAAAHINSLPTAITRCSPSGQKR